MSSTENGRAYVYILECADGSYYTGIAHTSVGKRVAEHNLGTYAGYTKSRRPVTLRYCEEFERTVDAIAFERQVKGWSRAKKEALIRRDWGALQALAQSRSAKRT